MRIIRTIPTPWHSYAVTFSRDGTRLAIGGGSWYGHGGTLLIRLEDAHQEMLSWDTLPGISSDDITNTWTAQSKVPTVSGLCFSDDDRFLAASMWLSCQHYRPSALFYIDGLTLEYRAQYEREFDAGIDPCPTGVLLHSPYLITRNHGGDPPGDDVLTLDPLPRDVCAGTRLQHLTHYRIIVVRDTAITEAGGSRGVSRRQPDGSYAPVKAPEGLALKYLLNPDAPLRIVEVEDCARITAIGALPGNQGFATGGSRGELDLWAWNGKWQQTRVKPPSPKRDPRLSDHIFYHEESISGVVSATNSELIAVTTGGKLIRWSSGGIEDEWELPEPGSPRSLAAHPQEPWVAVGIKQGDFGDPNAVVVIVDLE